MLSSSSFCALHGYGDARRAGATHCQILEVVPAMTSAPNRSGALSVYTSGLREGLSHQGMVEVLEDEDALVYLRASNSWPHSWCQYHDETGLAIRAAISRCAFPELYCRVRSVRSTTHEEALEAHDVFGRDGNGPVARSSFKKYLVAREARVSHAAALADTRPPPSKSKAVPPNAPAELGLPIVNAKA